MRSLFAFALLLVSMTANAEPLDGSVKQLVVSIAPDWNSSTGKLQRFNRRDGEWVAAGPPVPVLYGRAGLAWGRGVFGTDEPGTHKVERDKRAPAGVFAIGKVYGYAASLPSGANYPYHQVTEADVWSDDPRSPDYNRHMLIDPANPPDGYSRERMKPGDFAYRWLVEIRHNSDPIVPGAGSAIFFHIRRGENRPTSGCTTMAEGNLVEMIRWLRADARPHYALLPWGEYKNKWRPWGLPDLRAVKEIAPSN
jgi:L,D-peptidoglycan transpeptidase YkuD (ErfK/YbiS/YcfS/YnhG family)